MAMIKAKITLVATGLFLASAASAAPDGWKISEKSGTVTVLHSGVSKIALQGNAIAMGDVVNTGANGRAVLVRGQEYLVIAPNSRLRIADPAPSGGMIQILQDVGNVIFKIKRKSTPHFAVQTPYLAAVVKGTTFSVTVGEAGASVQVIEGAVEVKTNDGGASDLVRPGMIAAVTARDLFSIKIDGDSSHITTSPNASGKETTQPSSSEPDNMPVTAASEPVIETPIVETVQSVAALTGGLIEGSASFASPVRVVEVRQKVTATAVLVLPPEPADIAAAVVAQSQPVVATAAAVPTEVAQVPATSPVAVAPVVPAPVAVAVAPVVPVPVAVAVAPVVPVPVAVAVAPVAPAPVAVAVAPVAPAPVAVAVAPIVPAPVAVAVAPVAPAPVAVAVAPIVPAPVAVTQAIATPSSSQTMFDQLIAAARAFLVNLQDGSNNNFDGGSNRRGFGNKNGRN